VSKYKPEGAYKKEVYRLQQYIGKLEAQLAEHEKYTSVLDSCTELLEKHWPASMSCNGRLCVDGHLQNILNVLAAHEWVSVEDRLPLHHANKYSDWVLVMRDIPLVDNAGELCDMSRYNSETGQWSADNNLITHWKPIILPKESNNEKK